MLILSQFLLFNKNKYFLWVFFLRIKLKINKEEGDGWVVMFAMTMLACTTQSPSARFQIHDYLNLNFNVQVIYPISWSLTEKFTIFLASRQAAEFWEEIKRIWISEEILLLYEVILLCLYYFVWKINWVLL